MAADSRADLYQRQARLASRLYAQWRAYATYHLFAFNDIGKLSLQMGNSAPVIHSAYKGLVSKAEAERFLALRPVADVTTKIVALQRAPMREVS